MSVRVACTGCSQRFVVPETLLGKSVKCPKCATPFVAQPATDMAPGRAGNGNFDETTSGGATGVKAGAKRKGGCLAIAILSVLAVSCMGMCTVGGLVAWLASGRGPGVALLLPVDWKPFNSSDYGFTILMPDGKAAQSKQSDARVADQAVETQEFLAKGNAPGAIYSVHCFDLPDAPKPEEFFNGVKNKLTAGFPNGKIAGEEFLTMIDQPGREYTLDLPGNKVVVRRAYVVECRVFIITAQTLKSSAEENRKFFDSFTITNMPPSKTKPTPVSQPSGPTTVTMPGDSDPPVVQVPVKPDPGPVPAPGPGDKPAFNVSADEQALLTLINNYRADQGKKRLRAVQKLFDHARKEAVESARTNQMPALRDLGYRKTQVLTQPVPPNFDVKQVFDHLVKGKSTRKTMLDIYEDIGIGIAKKPDGSAYYLFVFAGNAADEDE